MNILFWNLQKKDLSNAIVDLCVSNNIDICAFAETDNLNQLDLQKINYKKIKTLGKVLIFSKYSGLLELIKESNRYSILKVDSPVSGQILLCFVHLISPYNSSAEGMVLETTLIASDIQQVKNNYKIDHVIVCGDFNQNPYSHGLVAAACFNATSDREIAKKMRRTVQGNLYEYFYNPMWKFYARNQRPFGTFFHRSSDHIAINWNILDQFLISSSLLNKVNDDDFKIITDSNLYNFVRKNGNIDYKNFSDHLPILMSSNI